jgi:hypothetical protein
MSPFTTGVDAWVKEPAPTLNWSEPVAVNEVDPSDQALPVAVPKREGPANAVVSGEAFGPPAGVVVKFGKTAVLVFVTVNVLVVC